MAAIDGEDTATGARIAWPIELWLNSLNFNFYKLFRNLHPRGGFCNVVFQFALGSRSIPSGVIAASTHVGAS